MSALPFMNMFWSDYFGDTRHLTCEQHGAYLQLIGCLWIAGGSLPNDPKKLAKITSCTPSRWAKIEAEVMAFFVVKDDCITHSRVSLELKKAREKSIKRAEVGSRGGKAKSLKNNKTGVAIATGLLKHPEPEPENKKVVLRTSLLIPSSDATILPFEGQSSPSTESLEKRQAIADEALKALGIRKKGSLRCQS